MRVLFLDDDPDTFSACARALVDAGAADVRSMSRVDEAIVELQDRPVDLLIMDLFIPMGSAHRATLGPRGKEYEEHIEHLGGLVMLDELARLPKRPYTLLYTACMDPVVMDLARGQVNGRIRKPASVDVILRAVLEALADIGAERDAGAVPAGRRLG